MKVAEEKVSTSSRKARKPRPALTATLEVRCTPAELTGLIEADKAKP